MTFPFPLFVSAATILLGTPVYAGSGITYGAVTVGPINTAATSIPAGSTIVVFVASISNVNISATVSDGTGNVYIPALQSWFTATNNVFIGLYYCRNCPNAVPSTTAIKATMSVPCYSGAGIHIAAAYLPGVSALDQISSGSGTSAAPNSGTTATLAAAHEVAFGFTHAYNASAVMTYTEAAGWTRLVARQDNAAAVDFLAMDFAYQITITNTALAYNPSISPSSSNWGAGIATFR